MSAPQTASPPLVGLPPLIQTERGDVVGFASYAEAVTAQIDRKKVKLVRGMTSAQVIELARTFEAALVAQGFAHKHYGCGPRDREVTSIFTYRGEEWRVWLTDSGKMYFDDYVDRWANLFGFDLSPAATPKAITEFVRASIGAIR